MSFQTIAQDLINANGRTITLIKNSDTPADANKPWRGPTEIATGETVTLKAVFTEDSESALKKALFGVAEGTGDIMRRPAKTFMIAALDLGSFVMADGDFIEDGDVRWSIVHIETLRPGDDDIMHTVEVRK